MLPGSGDLTLAPHFQIEFGQPEAVAGRSQRAESPGRPGSRALAEQEAGSAVGTTADPAAQLMELGEAEAVGSLDHHDGRVRDVDSDLDHCGRNQNVDPAVCESGHRHFLLCRFHLPVKQPDFVVGELIGGQSLGLGRRRPALDQRRFIDQRDRPRTPAGPGRVRT